MRNWRGAWRQADCNENKNKMQDTHFIDAGITQSKFVECILNFLSLTYDDDNSVFVQGERVVGTINCFGVPIVAYKLLGMLPPDFDCNLTWESFGKSKGLVLADIIHQNFDEVERNPDGFELGDILLYRWKDVRQSIKNVHHVGVWIGNRDKHPNGQMIHALDKPSGGLDKIYIQDMTSLELLRLDQVWRTKFLKKD